MEIFKTIFFMTVLTLLFIFIGRYVGGQNGMIIAFFIAAAMNFFSYFFSDKLVLRHYRAVQVDRQNARGFYEIVERLSQRANLPMPKVYIIPEQVPNAFATGRNPKNAAVAATEGLLNLLSEEEIEGVMAHELSHVKHYDILTGTIVATFAGAIAIIANFIKYGSLNSRNRKNMILLIVVAIILPIAASIIQMAVSRSREYMADEGAARLTSHPEWLQSALYKLSMYSKNKTMAQASQESAHMFIVNPFAGKKVSFGELFSTHPSTEKRIERLEALKGRV